MYKVLLILGSEDFRISLCDALQDAYDVTVCDSCQAREEMLHRQYDVLILDLFLPGIDGLTILKQVQDCRPPIVLMLTKFISPYILQEASDLGLDFIIRVPCILSTIINHLNDMVKEKLG